MESDIPFLAVFVRSILLLASFLLLGFFAGSETAFLSMDTWAIEGLKSDGDRRASILSDLAKDSRNTTSALLIGTNVFTVLASVMAASLADITAVNETFAKAVLPLIVTALMFFFSQLVPKTYASRFPTEMALAVAPTLAVLTAVLKPVSMVLSFGPYLVARLIGRKVADSESVSDEPVRLAVDLAAEEGQVDKEDSEVIVGVLDSSDTKVADIMVPLPSAFVLSPDTKLVDALRELRQHRFSRVPVVDQEGQVVGLVYMKDVLRQVLKDPQCDVDVRSLMRPPLRVSPSDNILDVLAPMRKGRIHLAIVVDGDKAVGIVTLDDILEEIVGAMPETARGRTAPRKPAGTVVALSDGLNETDGHDAAIMNEYAG